MSSKFGTAAPERTIGVLSGAAVSISLMIGSGIFSTPSSVLNLVGSPLMVIVLYVLGGFFSLGGAFSFIEMGIMFPKNGGTLRYLAHSFPKPRLMLSYLFAWSMIMCIRPGSIAANGPVISKYLVYAMAGGPDLSTKHPNLYANQGWIYRGIAVLAISLATLACMLSVKWSLRLINVLTLMKTTLLLFMGVTGILLLAGAIKHEKNDNFSRGFKGTKSNLGGYASALNKVFYSYDGWSNITYSVGEMINPVKNLPISATLGVGVVTGLYSLSILAYMAAVPISVALNAKEVLAAEFTNRIFGPVFGRIILPIFIGLSVFGSITAQIFSVGRIVSAAADVGYIPWGDKLSKYSPRFKTPFNALAFNWVITMIYLLAPPPGDVFDLLVDLVQYPTWIFYGMTAVGCVYLRYKYPSWELRKYKAFLPITYIFILVTIYLSVFPFIPYDKSSGTYPYYLSPVLGIVTLLIGFIPYYYRMYWWANKNDVDLTEWVKEEEQIPIPA
ncbi:High-affinity methionine permease [Smittium mucronatum]|uniref:High-affinity methionine permease n=1 Tax=Smittium mucronatum TaxID=133383 RepID=A0A1R0GVR9_9FUNG|nr:High-affinity methionine permease [Smittium mucronatum]